MYYEKDLLISVTILFWQLFAYSQTWEWVHAEPDGPAFYTGEDDAAHHVKTDSIQVARQ